MTANDIYLAVRGIFDDRISAGVRREESDAHRSKSDRGKAPAFRRKGLVQETDALMGFRRDESAQVDNPRNISPGRRTVRRNDALAALEGLRHHQAEILAQCRQHEDIAPRPGMFLLLPDGPRNDAQLRMAESPHRRFEVVDALQWMPPPQIKEMDIPHRTISFRMRGGNGEKAVQIQNLDFPHTGFIGTNPVRLGGTRRDNAGGAAKKSTLKGIEPPLLPPVVLQPQGVEASVGNADEGLARPKNAATRPTDTR